MDMMQTLRWTSEFPTTPSHSIAMAERHDDVLFQKHGHSCGLHFSYALAKPPPLPWGPGSFSGPQGVFHKA